MSNVVLVVSLFLVVCLALIAAVLLSYEHGYRDCLADIKLDTDYIIGMPIASADCLFKT